MPRPLVVVAEADAVMADLGDPAADRSPRLRRESNVWVGRAVDVHRCECVRREQVFHVHQEQFLVLLLVMAAQFDQSPRRLVQPSGLEETRHRVLHVLPVACDVSDPRAGHQPALWARVPRADGLVVGVEQVPVGRVVLGVGRIGPKDELLEEPRRMRPVPLGGARVRHGLRCLVLGRQAGGELVGRLPDGQEVTGESVGVGCCEHCALLGSRLAFCVPWPVVGHACRAAPEGPHSCI